MYSSHILYVSLFSIFPCVKVIKMILNFKIYKYVLCKCYIFDTVIFSQNEVFVSHILLNFLKIIIFTLK